LLAEHGLFGDFLRQVRLMQVRFRKLSIGVGLS
jgi:hypothetical protein